MPRALRIDYEGAIYHLMNRGDRREDIFLGDEDRRLFLKTLEEACGKSRWQVHAYCLMSNHFHLVVETQSKRPQPCCSREIGDHWQMHCPEMCPNE
jgi:REP element-mobilizing transposase RayT